MRRGIEGKREGDGVDMRGKRGTDGKRWVWGGWGWRMEDGMRKGGVVTIHADGISTKRRKKERLYWVKTRVGRRGILRKKGRRGRKGRREGRKEDETKKRRNECIACVACIALQGYKMGREWRSRRAEVKEEVGRGAMGEEGGYRGEG